MVYVECCGSWAKSENSEKFWGFRSFVPEFRSFVPAHLFHVTDTLSFDLGPVKYQTALQRLHYKDCITS
jgi:hypothetical protein